LGTFPLSVSANGRYLQQADGVPYFLHGDTPWEIGVRLTRAQIDTYLADRQSRGFNAIMFEAIEHHYNSAPAYRNAEGNDPFTTMSPVAWGSPSESYWTLIDYIVNEAKARGVYCWIVPAYYGFTSNSQGWDVELAAASAGDLQSYGAFLATRYTQGNVGWVKGGDNDMDSTTRAKQENIFTGITSVRSTDLTSAHVFRAASDAISVWGASAVNVNTIYIPMICAAPEASTAYARSPAEPFFLIEARYENESDWTLAGLRLQAWTAWLSGGCGDLFGVNPLWSFGDPNAGGDIGAAAALAGYLSTTGTLQRGVMTTFVEALQWHKLVPETGTTLVTSSLGTGDALVCPALASDGSFGVVWKNDASSITVNMAALAPSSVRARWFDPVDGSYSTVSGSPFANSGTQVIAHPGNNAGGAVDRVLLLDAAP